MTPIETVNLIRRHHRRRRFAMKLQQKLDRALESFVRINATEWSPDLAEDERERINRQVKELIKRIRAGEQHDLSDVVATSDNARAPADEMRATSEKIMEKLAKDLPVHEWVATVRGAGALGLATIVAEAGDLSGYSNPAKLWKRLGFAPYDGLAGSTWKRQTWRPRTLTADEWIENPFAGERYALIHQVAVWLVNTQLVGKAKTESGKSEANGIYGQVYVARRAHTETTHEDWSDGHRHMDAVRVTMKAFLKDLLLQWRVDRQPTAAPKRKRKSGAAAEMRV